jgi:hypothetical protein
MTRTIAVALLLSALSLANCAPPPPRPVVVAPVYAQPGAPPSAAVVMVPPRPEMIETPREAERETRRELRQYHRQYERNWRQAYRADYRHRDRDYRYLQGHRLHAHYANTYNDRRYCGTGVYRRPVTVRNAQGVLVHHPARCIAK